MFSPPGFFYAMFAVIRHVMSKKTIEKMGMCPGRSDARPSASVCPFASAHFDLATLPSFLGGGCHCTAAGGCIACTPNDQKTPSIGEGIVSIHVSSGGKHDVSLTARNASDRLCYDFTIESGGLEVSAWVTPEMGPAIQLMAVAKHRAEEKSVSGFLTVPVAGAVTLRFSNAHSRFHGKNLKLSASIMPGGAFEAEEEVAEAAAQPESVAETAPVPAVKAAPAPEAAAQEAVTESAAAVPEVAPEAAAPEVAATEAAAPEAAEPEPAAQEPAASEEPAPSA